MNGRGNAMLVGASIYQACKFYELFCQAGFKGKCAIVTSYVPQASDIKGEDSGEGATERAAQVRRSTARCWPTTSTNPPTRRWARSSSSRRR